MKHLADDPSIVERTRKILDLLRSIEKPENLPQVIATEKLPSGRRTTALVRPLPPTVDLPPLRLRAAPDDRW